MSFLSLAMPSTSSIVALQGASTAMGIMGALRSGSSNSIIARVQAENSARQSEAHAEADTLNAEIARQQAQSERERAAAEALDYRRSQGAKLASRRATFAAGGLALEGSPLLVDDSIFQEIEFGAQRIAHAGSLAETRLKNQASLLDTSAERNRQSADFARKAGDFTAKSARTASIIDALSAGVKGATQIGATLSGKGAGWGGTKKKEWYDPWSSADAADNWL